MQIRDGRLATHREKRKTGVGLWTPMIKAMATAFLLLNFYPKSNKKKFSWFLVRDLKG